MAAFPVSPITNCVTAALPSAPVAIARQCDIRTAVEVPRNLAVARYFGADFDRHYRIACTSAFGGR